jgi:transposase
MRARRRFSAEFKAKVALEAIKGQERPPSWRPSTNPTQIAAWKREAVEKLARLPRLSPFNHPAISQTTSSLKALGIPGGELACDRIGEYPIANGD